MIVVDTSVWVDFLRHKEPVFSKLLRLLEDRDVLAAEPVFAELLQGARNQGEYDVIEAYWANLPRVEAAGILIEAGDQSRRNHWLSAGVGLIDAAIIVTARSAGVRIWTLDARLRKALGKEELYG